MNFEECINTAKDAFERIYFALCKEHQENFVQMNFALIGAKFGIAGRTINEYQKNFIDGVVIENFDIDDDVAKEIYEYLNSSFSDDMYKMAEEVADSDNNFAMENY